MAITTEKQSIIGRLRGVGRAEHLWSFGAGLGITLLVSSALLLVLTMVEALFPGTIMVRTVLWYAWVIVTGGIAGGLLARPSASIVGLIPSQKVEQLALRVGDAYPDVRDNLSNALQLADSARRTGSEELAEAAFEHSAAAAHGKDFSVIINKRRTFRGLAFGMLSTLIVGGLLFVPALNAPFHRLLDHETSYLPPAPFKLLVRASADTLMRGTNASVEVVVQGTLPQEVTLWVKEGNADRFTPYPLEVDRKKPTIYQLPGLKSNVEFYAESPWNEAGVLSDTGRIVVIDLPLVRTMNGRVIPPSYTALPPTTIDEQQADITALKGSGVDLQITSNKNLHVAEIIIEQHRDSSTIDSTIIAMSIKGNVAGGKFSVVGNGTYHVRLTDVDGQYNVEPVKYGIIALSDGYPTIAMIEPTKDVDVDQEAKLPISVAIADDYGFSSLKLKYRLTRSRYAAPEEKYRELQIPVARTETTLDIGYVWDLNSVDITPDDIYEFYLEVADNDVVNGPKTARTSTYKVRLPSLEELFAEADQVHNQVEKELEQILKEAEQVRREADELQREMQKQQAQSKQQTEWSDKKKAEELAKKQQQLEKRMEEVTQKLEDMTDKLEQNQAISEETLKKYQELQELMKQVRSPELERMQQQMKQALEKMSPEQLEKMMKEMKFDEEQFKKNIERTMNLLKRIQAEQKADELAKRAEELARKQDELRKEAQNTNANNKDAREKLAQKQEQLQKDLKDLAKSAKDLEDLMNELGADMPTDMMQNAQEELDAEQTASDMKNAEQNMEKGDMQSAADKQKQASQNLQRFAQQMQQMQKQMRRNANKENMRQMQQGMQDITDLSRQQEELMKQMQSMDPNSAQFTQAAQQQQRLQQSMQNIANSMFQMSQRSTSVSPEMAQDLGNALQQMQSALGQMQDRNGAMTPEN